MAGRWNTAGARTLVRSGAIALVAGLFLAFSGAFQTGQLPFVQRALYWVGLLELGTAINLGLDAWAARSAIAITRPMLVVAIIFIGLTVALTPAVIGVNWWLYGAHVQPTKFAYIALAVLVISAVMTGVNILAERQPMLTHAEPPSTTQPPVPEPPTAKFVERLPRKLQGATLYAVEAQDHYLRLHTSRGSDLILMRLCDALAQLQGIEGAQVHRSWWVARDAVTGAQRAQGRAVLTLASGEEVPVSRTYMKALRDAGWL